MKKTKPAHCTATYHEYTVDECHVPFVYICKLFKNICRVYPSRKKMGMKKKKKKIISKYYRPFILCMFTYAMRMMFMRSL